MVRNGRGVGNGCHHLRCAPVEYKVNAPMGAKISSVGI